MGMGGIGNVPSLANQIDGKPSCGDVLHAKFFPIDISPLSSFFKSFSAVVSWAMGERLVSR